MINENPQRDYWDKFSRNYIQYFEDQTLANALVMYSLVDLSIDVHILEVGCASGMSIVHLIKKVTPLSIIHAIDFSSIMINACRARLSHTRVFQKQMDACLLMYEDDKFDYYFSNLTLPQTDDFFIALTEAHRVLKHNGTMVFSCWTNDDRSSNTFATLHHDVFYYYVHKEGIAINDEIPDFHEDDIDNNVELLETAGFRVKDYIASYVTVEDKEVNSIMYMIRQTRGVYYRKILKSKFEEFWEYLRRAYEKVLNRGQSVGFETMNYVCVCDKTYNPVEEEEGEEDGDSGEYDTDVGTETLTNFPKNNNNDGYVSTVETEKEDNSYIRIDSLDLVQKDDNYEIKLDKE